ncbi:MAG: PASTA domain-containing protein [Kiritimatiellaeota bacterium]|nr:PASTA domain-containing protein [Kiritimatiellota bacterium]
MQISIPRYVVTALLAACVISALTTFGGSSAQSPTNQPPPQVVVPNVVGMTLVKGQAALNSVGLKGMACGPTMTSDANVVGLIAQQSPSAGSKIPKGSQVNLSPWSKGRKK